MIFYVKYFLRSVALQSSDLLNIKILKLWNITEVQYCCVSSNIHIPDRYIVNFMELSLQ